MPLEISRKNDQCKIAYLFLTDKDSDTMLDAYSMIRDSVSPPCTARILFHHKTPTITERLSMQDPYLFTNESLLAMNYTPIVMNIIPGSNHFPLLQYFHDFPDYAYYWVIEDDMRFTGDWKYFFDSFNLYDHDLITSHIRWFKHEPWWNWWQSLSHTELDIPLKKRLRSFNPIYRISRRALNFIHRALSQKWMGHHEVLFPTLLYHNQYKLMDFGGKGDFVPRGNKNKFYTWISKRGVQVGTLRYRPVLSVPGNERNKLYHPVK